MPLSLKLPRRNPDRPTLRQRAAALKAAAGKVIRRPKPEEATGAAPVEAWVSLDTTLRSQVRELVTIEAEQTAILEAGSYANAFDAPDWVRLERTREAILARVIATRANTIEGVKAKASLLDLGSVKHFQQPVERLAHSIAADVAALGILPQPEQAASAPAAHVDPHTTLLPALRQAFAWDRACRPILEHADDFSPEGTACHAVTYHCWNTADRIIALPAPKTLAGLGALALALSVGAEEAIGLPENDGIDDEHYPEERRLAAAIQGMMSVAGVSPLPGWVGFKVEPDDRPRWAAMLAQQGEGSLPAWALAGKSGPDAGDIAPIGEAEPEASPISDLARSCLALVKRRAWLDEASNAETVNEDDEGWPAEFERQSVLFRRAVEEPSASASDVAAKARLMLDELERFDPETAHMTEDRRLMRVILREAIAQGGKPGPDDAAKA